MQALCARTFSALPVRARALRSRTLRGRTLRARTVSRIRACEPRRLRTRGSREFRLVWRTRRVRARSSTLPRVTIRSCKEPLAGRGGQQQERRRARISSRAGFCAPERGQRQRGPRVRAHSAPAWARRRALPARRRRMRTLRAPAKDARSAAVCWMSSSLRVALAPSAARMRGRREGDRRRRRCAQQRPAAQHPEDARRHGRSFWASWLCEWRACGPSAFPLLTRQRRTRRSDCSRACPTFVSCR